MATKICGHCGQSYDRSCDCIANETVARFIYEAAQRGGEKNVRKSSHMFVDRSKYSIAYDDISVSKK